MIPQRFLVMRLDRVGDVVLTTPLVRALREAYPQAIIDMMVRPACREVIEGHPALNRVLVYEKEGRHRGWLGTWRFIRDLRRQRFDVAIVAHPTLRSHLIAKLAGIPRRIGFDRKGGWMLTDRLPHRKQLGERHEAEYTLELLRPLGLTPGAPQPFVALREDANARVTEWLTRQGADPSAPMAAMHPSASCPSKRWPAERFAEVADQLVGAGAQVVLVAGAGEAAHAHAVAKAMRRRAVNAAGALSIGELACLLARCRLLVSNDSGPVHIAAAVGTPVVALFGRQQPGLSPRRWGPLGPGHRVLHRDVGCATCLAHDCVINFLCLKAIRTDEVTEPALAMWRQASMPSCDTP